MTSREFVAPGFEDVVTAFREGVAEPERSGAALSVWRDGVELINVWHGVSDSRTRSPWAANTTSVIFSCSKGLSALVMAQLHEEGVLDLDSPIADSWPEFAAHGKGALSIADVMAHRAGVSAPADDMSLEDALDTRAWAAEIAAQEPLWKPGEGHAYHSLTIGTIVQELVLRVTGRELHELFHEKIAAPLDADVTLKAGPGELQRVAHLVNSPEWDALARSSAESKFSRASTLGGAFPASLATEDGGFNDPRVQAAGFAAAGGIGTAAGLAKIWSSAIRSTDGIRTIQDATVRFISRVRSEGPWMYDVDAPHLRWGAGVELASQVGAYLSPTTFGHGGAGGQAGFADPETGVALGYVRSRLDTVNPLEPILGALREALGR
jgi:CubicO group peptidase (beta-lactamase class C family)